jgi:branched-subunit amino acid transport protein
MDNFWLALAGMTCITFSCRYFFFSKAVPFELGPKMKRLLSYTAPSVLTTMWVPIVFLGHKSADSAFISSPFLFAGLITVILSLKVKNTLAVVALGMSSFVVFKLTL